MGWKSAFKIRGSLRTRGSTGYPSGVRPGPGPGLRGSGRGRGLWLTRRSIQKIDDDIHGLVGLAHGRGQRHPVMKHALPFLVGQGRPCRYGLFLEPTTVTKEYFMGSDQHQGRWDADKIPVDR